jgi:hypothetical protein
MILLRSLAALALSAASLAAQSEARWVDVASDSAEAIAIDTATITAVGDSVYRTWERSTSPRTKGVRALARADFDCRLRLTRLVTVVIPGYQPVPASDEEREWTEIVPGSSYEAEWRQVCTRGGPVGGPR